MRYTSKRVHAITDAVEAASRGRFRLGYECRPGDGPRYVDGGVTHRVWLSGRECAAYYAGACQAYVGGLWGSWRGMPHVVRDVLADLESHPQQRAVREAFTEGWRAGRDAADRDRRDGLNLVPPQHYNRECVDV